MGNQLSSPTYSVGFPPEQGLSARQLVYRLAAHSDRRLEIRGRFEGGWVLWVSLSGHTMMSATSISSFHHDFEAALDHICSQIVERSFFSTAFCSMDHEYAA